MPFSQQIVVPSISLQPGPLGPFLSPVLPTGSTQFVVKTTPSVWPASGDVLELICEISFDNGVTFPMIAKNSLASVAGGLGTFRGAPILTDVWTTTLLDPTNASRRMRLSANVLQACTIGIVAGIQ